MHFLPPEIWAQVLNHVSRHDLVNLALVGRELSDFAHQRLYRDVSQPCPYRRKSSENSVLVPKSDPKWLGLLTRTVVALPVLGCSIKSLKIRDWSDDELAQLLFYTPNVESLVVDLEPMRAHPGPLLRDAFQSGLRLNCLRTVQLISNDGYKRGFTLADVLFLLQLRTLEEFCAHRCGDAERPPPPLPIFRPRSLHVQVIDLTCSMLSDGELEDLLRGCRALQSFRVTFARTCRHAISFVDFERLSAALATQSSSLRSLIIDFGHALGSRCVARTSGQLQLSSFPNLHHIDVPAWSLTEPYCEPTMVQMLEIGNHLIIPKFRTPSHLPVVDLLPRSLETLVVRSCRRRDVNRLLGLDLPASCHLRLIASPGFSPKPYKFPLER